MTYVVQKNTKLKSHKKESVRFHEAVTIQGKLLKALQLMSRQWEDLVREVIESHLLKYFCSAFPTVE